MRIANFALLILLGAILNLPVFGTELDRGVAAYQSKRYAEALRILLPLANGGNDEAQRIVGEMCYSGQGMKRNVVGAFKWNELAAESGNKGAQYNLGYLYEKGEGVAASRTQAIDWYMRPQDRDIRLRNENWATYTPTQTENNPFTGTTRPGRAAMSRL